ncbi:uncharacterized protein HKW66_Vig0158570 [Vigna angularis]|uniref:Uncharacterized protein n=1 Tax=Phaseolus angularis TaxID=3914 RepID=A0A8T0JKN9_PHAAN|nr:uncharacterized protein HKW66_Vig0158570 [Vigna angularis]
MKVVWWFPVCAIEPIFLQKATLAKYHLHQVRIYVALSLQWLAFAFFDDTNDIDENFSESIMVAANGGYESYFRISNVKPLTQVRKCSRQLQMRFRS